jgi:TolB-like protein/Flp pilus assembly protein TadD/DNA-binding winged helix-turn-helix (wHTH) protein
MELTESGARSRGATPFHFDDIVVDPAAHTLLRAGVPQPVEPKAFAVLLALLQHPGELIGRDDLLDLVWGHRHVTPGVLTRVIAQLRHALGDDPQQPRYIQTRHALGYSFIGQLHDEADTGTSPAPAPAADRAGVDELPAAEVQGALPEPPEPPAIQREQVPLPREQRADPESSWSVPEATPTHGQAIDWYWRRRRWLALAVLLSCALVTWAVLQRITPAPRTAASIAVMPFTSLSGHPGDEYFAEGLAEEMRDALAGVKGLKVAAPVSADTKSAAADAKALGARLGVATILDASVRREGPRIRITAHLSDTATGFTLWSHTYDRELSGIFATQSEIAGEVVRALLGSIPGESDALTKRLTPTHNEAAFDIYLQGLNLLHQTPSADTADKAIERFGQALKQDSGFAKAQAGVCRAEIWRLESKHSAAAFDNAKLACQRAAQMDPTLPEVDLAMGDLYRIAGDSERALQYFRKSMRAPDMRVRAHIGAAVVYAGRGQHDLSVQEFQQALQLSPSDPIVLGQLGYQQYLDGNVPQAVISLREAVKLRPGNAYLWDTLGGLYVEAGNNADAEQAMLHSIAIEPTPSTLSNLGLLKYQAGDYAAAVDLQRQAIALDPQDFEIWGNLGGALRADPRASAADVHKAYEQAAVRAEAYLKVQPDNARAVALLGLYRVVLGDTASARMLVKRAESLPGQPGEVALVNAETLALLGDIEPARQRLATARAAGIADTVIATNLTFRRLGLLSPPGTASKSAGAEPPVPRESKGHPPGG